MGCQLPQGDPAKARIFRVVLAHRILQVDSTLAHQQRQQRRSKGLANGPDLEHRWTSGRLGAACEAQQASVSIETALQQRPRRLGEKLCETSIQSLFAEHGTRITV